MSRKFLSVATAVLVVATVAVAAQTASAEMKLAGPVQLAFGKTGWKLLVPASYPLDASGRKVSGRIQVGLPRQTWAKGWRAVPHSGVLRLGDTRRQFRFVHGVSVPKRIARGIVANGSRTKVMVKVSSGDGFTAAKTTSKNQTGLRRARAGLCETLPRIDVRVPKSGYRQLAAPACGARITWQIGEPPPHGGTITFPGDNTLRFRPRPNASGTEHVLIHGYRKGQLVAAQRIHFRIGQVDASKVSVVAFGDSVTAGFGYFGATGKPMTIGQLLDCRPGATVFNDACSSNSYNRNSSVGSKPKYLPDYGLSRNISWAAQWANEYGITNFKNLAVTGSAPSDWLPGGQFHSTLEQIQTQNPDYILMTLGANPLLSDVLFNVDVMGCALESDLFGDFRQCVLDAFATVDLGPRMNQVFTELVENTTSKIVLMQYPLSIPSSALAYSAVQLEQMESLLNEVIASEAAQVSSSRINIVSPPRFNVGIDMEPMYPSNFSCSFLGYKVDGPSVQSTPTQDELEIDHPLSFCSGPAIGQPWVISGDTGIHPSAAGYFQMASQIPAPGS